MGCSNNICLYKYGLGISSPSLEAQLSMNSFFINFRLRRPRAAFLDIVCSVVQWAETGKMVQMFVRTSCYFLHDINYLSFVLKFEIATSLNFHFFWLSALYVCIVGLNKILRQSIFPYSRHSGCVVYVSKTLVESH